MRQIAILGIGVLGYNIAYYLMKQGVDVIAVDKDRRRIDRVKEFVLNAAVADITDADALRRLGVDKVDLAVVAIGDNVEASILATAIDYPMSNIAIDDRLYGAEPKDVLSIIGDLDDGIHCAMLVGHNPTFTALINALGRCDLGNVPTCGMAVLTFPIDSWKNIATIQGTLVDFDFPKNDAK